MRGSGNGRTKAGAMVLAALFALATLFSGCGGSDSGSEAALRKKLQAGAAKTAAAGSLRASVLIEIEEEGVSEEVGCVDLDVDSGPPESFDLIYFDLNCSGGSEAHELIAIGRRAWGSTGPEGWTEAKISPKLLKGLDEERTDLKDLFAAAEGIDAVPEGNAVEEGEGNFVDVTSYDFEAPASALPGSDEDLGDATVDFEAVLDRKGYLREVGVHGDEDGTGATVTDSFEDIGQDLGIRPPDPSEVNDKASTIQTKADLEKLFGVSP